MEEKDVDPPQYQPPGAMASTPVLQAPQPQIMHPPPVSTTNVVVVHQQPQAETNKLMIGNVYGHRDWTTGLCSCTEDIGGCIKSLCCTGCTLMEIAAKLNENLCVVQLVPGSLVTLRTRIRTLGGIKGSILQDYITVCCCQFCAICQMEREIHNMHI